MGTKPRTLNQAASLKAALARLRPKLASDATFVDDYGNDLDRLESAITKASVQTVEDFLMVFCGGARGMVIPAEESKFLKEDTYMYVALELLRNIWLDETETQHVEGDVAIEPNGGHIILGDVVIDGNVSLGAQAMFVVAGDLTIHGNLLANVWYSRVAVGGTLTLRSGMTQGELICGKEIRVGNALVLTGNDVSCRAPRLSGKTVLVLDKYSKFPEVDVENYIDFRDTANAAQTVRRVFGDTALDSEGWIDIDAIVSAITA
jgi:hypothetical protein